MPRFCIWLILGCLVAGLTQASTERLPIPGIQGDDDRELVKKTDYPWGAIGRVNNTLGPFCTGTLIGPLLLEREGRYHIVAMLVAISRNSGKGIAVTGKAFHERVRNMGNPAHVARPFRACQVPGSSNRVATHVSVGPG